MSLEEFSANFYLFSNEAGDAQKVKLLIEFELATLELDKAKNTGEEDKIIKALEQLRKAIRNMTDYLSSEGMGETDEQ